MILYIDTSQRGFLKFALINKENVFFLKRKVGIKQSEKALSFLDNFLKKNKVKLIDIKKIVVNRGPGSFTSVRLGIVLANTLSLGLKIPIQGVVNNDYVLERKRDFLQFNNLEIKKNNFIIPYYGRGADITKSKNKFKINVK